jgi:hypothetical protein
VTGDDKHSLRTDSKIVVLIGLFGMLVLGRVRIGLFGMLGWAECALDCCGLVGLNRGRIGLLRTVGLGRERIGLFGVLVVGRGRSVAAHLAAHPPQPRSYLCVCHASCMVLVTTKNGNGRAGRA